MSVAVNFPDISLSPIRFDAEEQQHAGETTHGDCQETFAITIDRTRAFDDGSFQRSGASESCRNENHTEVSIEMSLDQPSGHPLSSDDVFLRLEEGLRSFSLFGENQGDGPSTNSSDEIQDSAHENILRGFRVVVEIQCCQEWASTVRRQLRSMGAVVSPHLSSTVTHVIFSTSGRKKILQDVLLMECRPLLLDPQWVHDCWTNVAKLDEERYSLYGGRYLIESLRRLSSATGNAPRKSVAATRQSGGDFVELSPDVVEASIENVGVAADAEHVGDAAVADAELVGDAAAADAEHVGDAAPIDLAVSMSRISLSESSHATDMTFDQPVTGTQLLEKINRLQKRLNKLEGAHISNCEVHGTRCKSRTGNNKENSSSAVISKSVMEAIRSSLQTGGPKAMRRRTHAAFGVQFREPLSTAVQLRRENKDEEDAVNDLKRERVVVLGDSATQNVQSRDDTRLGAPQTLVDDMKKTMVTDLTAIRKKLVANAQLGKSKRRNRSRLEPIQEGNVENERRGVSGNVSGAQPLIKTRSGLINRIQCEKSTELFLSVPRNVRKGKKNGVVLSGFTKRDEEMFEELITCVGLEPQQHVGPRTRCVVSARGDRTLTVLRAVVLRVPVVSLEWLDECITNDAPVPVRQFEYDQWKHSIERRKLHPRLFGGFGKVLVMDNCTPATADLRWMIKKCGGKVTSSLNECGLVVGPPLTSESITWRRNILHPPPVVCEKYILDCITNNEILLFDNYTDGSILEVTH